MPKKRRLKLQEERDGPPTQSMNVQLRVKKRRKAVHTDLKAKKRTMLKRMRSIANTRQRKKINLKAAVKAERRVRGRKAERRVTKTKVRTEKVARGAKTEIRKKSSPSLIKVKIEIRVMTLIKSLKRMPKVKMARRLGQSHKARKDTLQKMNIDPVAESGTGAHLLSQKTKKRNKTKAKSGAESVARVRRDGPTARGRIGNGEHPEIRNIGQGVQTEINPETPTEAGAREARVITKETPAKIGRLIGRTKSPTDRGGDVAAAQTVTGRRRGSVRRVQVPNAEKGKVPPELKTGEAQPLGDQIARRAESATTARGINPALALTATELITSYRDRSRFELSVPYLTPTKLGVCSISFLSRVKNVSKLHFKTVWILLKLAMADTWLVLVVSLTQRWLAEAAQLV